MLGFLFLPHPARSARSRTRVWALGAARQIANGDPIAVGSPVLFFGKSGVGKTHLMHAIVNALDERQPRAQIRYGCAEWLSQMANFREYLLTGDLVVIEGIHFVPYARSDRARLLRDFGDAINALVDAQKQVVLEADRPAEELRSLGLPLPPSTASIEIKTPDLATRIAMLRLKARQHPEVDLSDEVVLMIAEPVSCPRALEGALHRLREIKGPVTLKRSRAKLRDLLAAYEGVRLAAGRLQ